MGAKGILLGLQRTGQANDSAVGQSGSVVRCSMLDVCVPAPEVTRPCLPGGRATEFRVIGDELLSGWFVLSGHQTRSWLVPQGGLEARCNETPDSCTGPSKTNRNARPMLTFGGIVCRPRQADRQANAAAAIVER